MERNKVLDIAKGLGILLVVFAHTLQIRNGIAGIIYFFHMPLFFFLSGMALYYTYKKKENISFKEFTIKKAKSILVPYLVFGLLCFAYWVLIERGIRAQENISVLQTFINIFLARTVKYVYAFNAALWFLPCLFAAEIIFYFIVKLMKKYQHQQHQYIYIYI